MKTFIKSALVVSLAAMAVACDDASIQSPKFSTFVPSFVPPQVAPTTTTTRFVAIGDTGTGGPEQMAVATAFNKVCADKGGCDFVVIAGDNVYEMGVTSVDDALFDAAFEQPYAEVDLPFYMALGNHDNSVSQIGEGSQNGRGDFQVDYYYCGLTPQQGNCTGVTPSGKWQMPDRYYTFTWPPASPSPLVEFFVIDSSPLSQFSQFPDDTSGDPDWADWNDSSSARVRYRLDQESFFQQEITASNAQWKFALAHHPYKSNGDHGNAGDYDVNAAPDPCVGFTVPGVGANAAAFVENVEDDCRGDDYKRFLENTICNQADIFFQGHDHDLQWHMADAACGKTEFILSGAAAKERELHDDPCNAPTNDRNPLSTIRYARGVQYGFFIIDISNNILTTEVYLVDPDDPENPKLDLTGTINNTQPQTPPAYDCSTQTAFP